MKFDSKSFNEKNFKYSVEHTRIPNLKTNELKKSKALKGSKDIRDVFKQDGTAYARTTNSKIYCMSEENYLPGIFDVSKQGLNLEENDEICNIDIVKYKGHLIDQVKVINTIQGHMYVYYTRSMPE